MKEIAGIVIGIILMIVVPILVIGYIGSDEQKGRTIPVQSFAWEYAVFDDDMVRNTLKDLDIREMEGLLFRQDSQTPLYFPVYIGKSKKGKEAIKLYFKNAKEMPGERYEREISALKLMGAKEPVQLFLGKTGKGDEKIYFSGSFVVVTFPPQATDVFLDEPQMIHFLHRYFQKRSKKENASDKNIPAQAK